MQIYSRLIADKVGEDIFCIQTRAKAKAKGEEVGEVHGANKPLDPNYKPEHQSKSTLPSMINNKGVRDTPVKPILKTPSTPITNKVGNESKRVTVAPIQLTPQVPEQSCQTPERQQRSVVKVPIKTAVPRATQGSRDVVGTPFRGDLGPLAPRHILSNKILGENGEDVINEEIKDLPTEQVIKTWRGKTQQVYQPPPHQRHRYRYIRGAGIGNT